MNAPQKALQVRFQVHFIFRGYHSIDTGGTTLACQSVGLQHPFQIDDVTQRVQRYSGLSPRQFRYLLPFRVQVCRVQCPLPCFPSTVLFIVAPPFSPPGPLGQVPRLRRYYGDATPSCSAYRLLMASLPASALPSLASCVAYALLSDPRRSFQARGISMPASPIPASLTRTVQDLSGSLAIHPMPLPCSKTPAESSHPRHNGSLDAAPAPNTAKAPAIT